MSEEMEKFEKGYKDFLETPEGKAIFQEAHASKIKQLGEAVIEAARLERKLELQFIGPPLKPQHLAPADKLATGLRMIGATKERKDAVDAYEEALRSLSGLGDER